MDSEPCSPDPAARVWQPCSRGGKPRSSTLPRPSISLRSASPSSTISSPCSAERPVERWIATECSTPSNAFIAIPISSACSFRRCCTIRNTPSDRLSITFGSVSPRTWATRMHGWPSHRFSARRRAPWRRVLRSRSAESFAPLSALHWARRPRVRGGYRRRSGGWNVWGSSTPQVESGRLGTRGLEGGSPPGKRGRGRGDVMDRLPSGSTHPAHHHHRHVELIQLDDRR